MAKDLDAPRRAPDSVNVQWMVTAIVPASLRLGDHFHVGAAAVLELKLKEAWPMIDWSVEPCLG